MRVSPSIVLFGIALVFSAISSPARSADAEPFVSETLAEGVHLFRPATPGGERANSLVVEREDGLLVVDAQPTPAAARELLSAIARQLSRPVRYLALTHPHAEAAGGASAFPSTVLVIASAGCRQALADAKYDFGAETRARAADPAAWREPERRPPVLVLSSPTSLEDPKRQVLLIPLHRAHSRGDLLVSIPAVGVLAIGHLVPGDRNPFPDDASLTGWMLALNDLEEHGVKQLVPLRGPALVPREALVLRDALLWVKGQVAQLFVDRLPPGTMPDRVVLSPDAAKYFDTAASPGFLRGIAELAVEEAQGDRRRRGIQ
jgi:glyoxylase-like metal-dependent hydrolase (beta-lactamase superfamily II)